MIDLNRATDDVDWDMIGGGTANADAAGHGAAGHGTAGHGAAGQGGKGQGAASAPATPLAARRARSGLGLVPRRLPGLGELWKWRIDHHDLTARIDSVHGPYHAALAQLLETVRLRWGAVLLIDLHSMPPLPSRSGEPAAEFVVGDRFGAACDGALVAEAFASLGQARRLAAHNRPYAGGYVLDRHARRAEGLHALQLEIDRRLYLDAALAEPGPGLPAAVDVVHRVGAAAGWCCRRTGPRTRPMACGGRVDI